VPALRLEDELAAQDLAEQVERDPLASTYQGNLMMQSTLFDPPATRATDPVSSWVAEAEHTASGKRARNRDYVRQLVALHPGSTAPELYERAKAQGLSHLSFHEIYRRLNDLADESALENDPQRPIVRGEKQKCKVRQRNLLTWWLK
jgi:hypothetical protein